MSSLDSSEDDLMFSGMNEVTINREAFVLVFGTLRSGIGVEMYLAAETCLNVVGDMIASRAFTRFDVSALTDDMRDCFHWTA